MVCLFTDGSWYVDSGRVGGWAFRYIYNGTIYKESGGAESTTNNRMEMIAAIEGLDNIIYNNHDSKKIIVFSDSKYLVDGASVWMKKWKRNKWQTNKHDPVKNKKLWTEIDILVDSLRNGIEWKWIPGHAGNPHNEAVDVAARDEAKIMKRRLGYG